MTSAVSICSNALIMLGAAPISSLEEATPHARICSMAYPSMRDSLLRLHSWNCAVKRVVLSPLAEKPDFDFAYQFQLPGDWLRNLQIGYEGCKPAYRSEGRRILTCINALPLVYVWRNQDESTWTSNLVELAELAMQARLAYAVTKSAAVRDSAKADYQAAIKLAKAIDGQDDPPDEIGMDSTLEDARFGRGRRW